MVVSDVSGDYISETFADSFKPLSGEIEETLNNLGEVSCNPSQ
jgi:hypothetical protein